MSSHSKQVFAWAALAAAGFVAGPTPQTHAPGDSQPVKAQGGAEWTLRWRLRRDCINRPEPV